MRVSLVASICLLYSRTCFGFFGGCGCKELFFSSICPTSACSNSLQENDECTLRCTQGVLYYKSGLPWRASSSLSCRDERYFTADELSLGFIGHITCIEPEFCNKCTPFNLSNDCPSGEFCNDSFLVGEERGCTKVSCNSGDLMVLTEDDSYKAAYLVCSKNGGWYDQMGRRRSNIRAVACVESTGCRSCQLPASLDFCDENATCNKKILMLEEEEGCRVTRCKDFGYNIMTQLNTNKNDSEVVLGLSELRCSEEGTWQSFDEETKLVINYGVNFGAVCYWPFCKKCLMEELKCDEGEMCNITALIDQTIPQRCDEIRCSEGYQLIETNQERNSRPVPTPSNSSFADYFEDQLDEEEGSGMGSSSTVKITESAVISLASVAVTCKKFPKGCQRCKNLTLASSCPSEIRLCTPVIQVGGADFDECKYATCSEEGELWGRVGTEWASLGPNLMCSEKGSWLYWEASQASPYQEKLPRGAQVTCMKNGDCKCEGKHLGTSSSCSSKWPDGCDVGGVDLFAFDSVEGCNIISCRYNGTLALFEPQKSVVLIREARRLICVGKGIYIDESGNAYTQQTAAVTCKSWEGLRHCARNCVYESTLDSLPISESLEMGCKRMECEDGEDIEIYDEESDSFYPQSHLRCGAMGWWTSPVNENNQFISISTTEPNSITVRCPSENSRSCLRCLSQSSPFEGTTLRPKETGMKPNPYPPLERPPNVLRVLRKKGLQQPTTTPVSAGGPKIQLAVLKPKSTP